MASGIEALDEAIKEYLLFRGFTESLKWFENERKSAIDKSYRVSDEGSLAGH